MLCPYVLYTLVHALPILYIATGGSGDVDDRERTCKLLTKANSRLMVLGRMTYCTNTGPYCAVLSYVGSDMRAMAVAVMAVGPVAAAPSLPPAPLSVRKVGCRSRKIFLFFFLSFLSEEKRKKATNETSSPRLSQVVHRSLTTRHTVNRVRRTAKLLLLYILLKPTSVNLFQVTSPEYLFGKDKFHSYPLISKIVI